MKNIIEHFVKILKKFLININELIVNLLRIFIFYKVIIFIPNFFFGA